MLIVMIHYNNNKMNFLIEDLYSKFYGTVDTDSDTDTDSDSDDDTDIDDTVGSHTVGTVGDSNNTVGNDTEKVDHVTLEKPVEVVCKCDVSNLVSTNQLNEKIKEITANIEKSLQEYKSRQDKLKCELFNCINNIRDIKKNNKIRITLLNYLLYMSNLHSVMCPVCSHNHSSHNCRMSYTMVPRFRSGGGSVFNFNSLTTFVMGLDDKCLNYFANINLQYINERLANFNNYKEHDKFVIVNESLETDKLVYNMLWKVKKNM